MTPVDFPVKAAIFDIGATLVTGPPVAPNKVIAQLFLRSDPGDCRFGDYDLESGLGAGLPRGSGVAFRQTQRRGRRGDTGVVESQKTGASEIERATETVMSLKDRGLKIGLLSDIWRPYYESVEVAIPKIVEAADAIVLSCRTGARKPSHKNFARVVEELGVEYQDVVMIGDTYSHDILPALELGMRAVWVLAGPTARRNRSLTCSTRMPTVRP